MRRLLKFFTKSFSYFFKTTKALFQSLGLIVRSSPSYTAFAGVLSLIQALLPAVAVWVGKLGVDAVVAHISGERIEIAGLPAAVFYAVCYLAAVLFVQFNGTILHLVQGLLVDASLTQVNLDLMKKANRFEDLSVFENPHFYDDLKLIQDTASYAPMNLLSFFTDICQSLIITTSMLYILAQFHPLVPLVVFLASLPQMIAQGRLEELFWMGRKEKTQERRKLDYFREILMTDTYAKEVRLFGLGSYFLSAYRRVFFDIFRYLNPIRWKQGKWMGLCGPLSALGAGGMYVYVIFRALENAITLGELTMYTSAVVQIYMSLQGLTRMMALIKQISQYMQKYIDFLSASPRMPVKPLGEGKKVPVPLKRGFELRGVKFRYPGTERDVLCDLDLTFQAGECVALVGANGAGKTTLVKLLSRLYDPTEGEILLEGIDLREYDIEFLRRQIGVIFQDFARYQLTVRENIGLGHVERVEDMLSVRKAANKSGAHAFIERLDKGYETLLGKQFEGGRELSLGEWQKLALARAFMGNAQILILDEPTASLDAQTEYEVYLKFNFLTAGKTTLLISHRFSTVRMAKRIIVLEKGRIIEEGNHLSLITAGGRYAELYALQAEQYRGGRE